MELAYTGERLTTEISGENAYEHLHRYAFAAQFVAGKTVLDIASGEGYGSHLLARQAAKVIGVDIAEEAVLHAQNKYRKDNLSFITGSVTDIPLPDKSVEVVVTFETIEHITDHDKMISEMKRVLKPGGILVISTPNKEFYSDQTNQHNDYHLKELYLHEFKTLLNSNFKHTAFLGQKFFIASLLFSAQSNEIESLQGDFDALRQNGNVGFEYSVGVASDDPLSTPFNSSLFENDALYEGLHKFYKKKIESIYHSRSYKIGNSIVRPIDKLMHKLKLKK